MCRAIGSTFRLASIPAHWLAKTHSTPHLPTYEVEVSPNEALGAEEAKQSETFEPFMPPIIEKTDEEEDEMTSNLQVDFRER